MNQCQWCGDDMGLYRTCADGDSCEMRALTRENAALRKSVARVIAEEREACASLVESLSGYAHKLNDSRFKTLTCAAASIRARSDAPSAFCRHPECWPRLCRKDFGGES